jgi:hypothetical protein
LNILIVIWVVEDDVITTVVDHGASTPSIEGQITPRDCGQRSAGLDATDDDGIVAGAKHRTGRKGKPIVSTGVPKLEATDVDGCPGEVVDLDKLVESVSRSVPIGVEAVR